LQILFREIGIFVPEEIIRYSQWVLDNSNDFLYQYFLRKYNWTLVDPPVTLDLDGRYDHGFMHFSRMLGFGFHALLLFCTSVQLEMNFQVFDINFNYGAPEGVKEKLEALIRTLEILLYDPIFPNGLVVLPDEFAVDQIQDGGKELGNMFGSLASWIEYMFDDRDKQEGKAISYTDENENYNWDDGETLTVRGLEIAGKHVEFTRPQMQAVHDLAIVLRDNFLEREPFPIEAFRPVLDAFGLEALDSIVDLFIAWSEDGTADWSEPFYNPQRFSFRDLLATLVDKLHIIDEVMGELGVE
jgi:hypothetical protein